MIVGIICIFIVFLMGFYCCALISIPEEITMTIPEITDAMNNCANGKCDNCPVNDCKQYLIEYLGGQCRKIAEMEEDDDQG